MSTLQVRSEDSVEHKTFKNVFVGFSYDYAPSNETMISEILDEIHDTFHILQLAEPQMFGMSLAGAVTSGMILFITIMCCFGINERKERIERLRKRQSISELEKFKKDLVKKLVENYEKHKPAKKPPVDEDNDVKEKVTTWIADNNTAQEPNVDKPVAIKTDNRVAPEMMTQDQRIIYIPAQLPVLEFDINSEARPVTAGDIEEAWNHKRMAK